MRTTFLFLMFFAVNAIAEGLPIKTGKWETTTTSSNSMMPNPQTMTDTNCVDIGVFEPEDMINDAEECDVLNSSVQDNTLNFEMVCRIQGSETTVKGSFFSEDDHGEGNMMMSMKMGQMEMQVNTEWTSRYVGSCD